MTGVGALPFVFVQRVSESWLGYSNAIAGGVMLAASHSLLAEGAAVSTERVLIGMLLGLAAIVLTNWLINREDDVRFAELDGADARKVLLRQPVFVDVEPATQADGILAFWDTRVKRLSA